MNQIMQWNLSIDFTQKNNPKAPLRPARPVTPQVAAPATTQTTTQAKPVIVARPAAPRTHSSAWRPNDRRPVSHWPKITSEAFLRHKSNWVKALMEDPKKLIKKDEIPVRVIWLWWLEQIWCNMTVIEYKTDIIIIDAGIQFASAQMLGVDYTIPDISYLIPKKKNIRWIFITHWHLDHIWALRHILPDLGYPIVYTTPLPLGLIRKNLDDKDNKLLKYKMIDPDMDILKLGAFTVEFYRLNHSIPEAMGFSVHTPKWLVVVAGDFKIDHTPSIDRPADLWKIARIWQEWTRLFLGESTNANKPWCSVSERVIWQNLDKIIRDCTKERIVISTFASNIGRLIQIIDSAVKYNKVVFLAGRSMINNIQLCQELWYITVPKQMIRPIGPDIENMPDERVVVLCTWSQGEEFSALVRMASNTYKDFVLKPKDVVLLSTHTIPGNEKAVIDMTNDLIRLGVEIVDDGDLDVHTSGHGYQEDIKTMLSLLKPEYYMPIHGEPFMRHANKKLATAMGLDEQHVLLPDNWQIVELYDNVILTTEKKVKLDTVMIDGKGQGHLSGEYVMKARGIMSECGVVALIFKVDTKTKEIIWNIQIESRGFVYSSEVKSIHTQIVEFARTKYIDNWKRRMDIKDNLKLIKEDLGEYINKIIGRVPMIMTMFVYINRDPQINADVTQDEAIVGMTLDEQGYDD